MEEKKKEKRTGSKKGRTPEYTKWITEDGLLKIKCWARDGYSNNQIAEMMGVKRQTLLRWKNDFSVINDALEEGRKPVALKIEDAFYRRCMYDQIEEVTEEEKDGKNGLEKVKKVSKKTILPDTTAMIFALKNLMPEKYKDRHETVISTKISQEDIDCVEDFINGVDGKAEKDDQ